ncbi:Diacetyl reductase [(S)-acetoin forming] [Planctomycetes bacterium Pla163]|uniref:Diacetyl reductase [(S)-acetoin forming] n=1 Tax=Rohdeia mirabilis TaxID=2528008 RepID=A0A518CY74_9BACT|nr:Diacetyl reductase [(S)-acetoin forming] [Planctomycetes bacterium Pla163]
MQTRPTALVTGASRGIGAAIARTLAAHGIDVVLGARSTSALERLAAEIEAEGGRATAVELDVTDDASVRAAVTAAQEWSQGALDLVVNNAGIAESAPLLPRAGRPGPDYARHLDVNLHGPRRVVEAAAPAMLEAGGGAIVNVASSAALRGYAYVAAYCASKHALLGYTRSAALETGPRGLRWFAICPHYVDSPMLAASIARVVEATGRTLEEARAQFAAQNPGGALVSEQQVADAVLAAHRGTHVPGVIELDGVHARQIESWEASARD